MQDAEAYRNNFLEMTWKTGLFGMENSMIGERSFSLTSANASNVQRADADKTRQSSCENPHWSSWDASPTLSLHLSTSQYWKIRLHQNSKSLQNHLESTKLFFNKVHPPGIHQRRYKLFMAQREIQCLDWPGN